MNRQPDMDQLLRSWLDHGLDTPPERDVRAALERIETTRQRGARWVSLEERIMRAQPYASIAAVVAIAVIGFAVWFGLAAGPKVGEPDVRQTPLPGAVETEEFFEPFTLVLPDDWVIVDNPNAVVIRPSSSLGERIVVFRTEAATIWGGQDEGYMPWPIGLVAWMEEYPAVTQTTGHGSLDVNFRSDADITVGGDAARLIDASYNFEDTEFGDGMTFISVGPESLGTNAVVFGGGGPFPVQFVEFSGRGVAIYHETQSSDSLRMFRELLDSVRFTDR